MTHAQIAGLLSAIAALAALGLNLTSWFGVGFGGEGIYVKRFGKVVIIAAIVLVAISLVFLFLPEQAAID